MPLLLGSFEERKIDIHVCTYIHTHRDNLHCLWLFGARDDDRLPGAKAGAATPLAAIAPADAMAPAWVLRGFVGLIPFLL